jgi:hypothetical protein
VPLHQQLDLRLEDEHLDRFCHNFRCAAILIKIADEITYQESVSGGEKLL